MKVYIKNFGEITLNKSDFISSGGEGSIYAKGPEAYKIYMDPSHMIPEGKIQELSAITQNNIIKPKEILYDNKNKRIGYSMRFVNDTYALCQLFTRAFRERNNITNDQICGLVSKLHDIVEHIHSKNILIVDCNEMNFLVNKQLNDVYAIDVDSYQTPHYPATALMESVRDRHSKGFNQNTDWFAFGIVSFQLFIAIHPYKGKHPTLKTLDERMIKNVSVFNKDVGIPKVCYSLDSIPEVYKQWYKAIFENGKRLPPPKDLTGIIHVITTPAIDKISGSDNFEITLIDNFEGTILEIIQTGGVRATLTSKKFYINNRNFTVSNDLKLALTNKTNTTVLAKLEKSTLKLFDGVAQKEIVNQLAGTDLMSYDNRLYLKNCDKIIEVQLDEIGTNILVSGIQVGSILENASKFYDGVIVQDLLGSCYVSMFPTSKSHKQVHIKELDKYKIIDAKYYRNVLMMVGFNKTTRQYNRYVIRFDNDDYDIRSVDNISPSGINFTVLDNGLCICLNEEENLEIFSSKKNSQQIKIIDDPILNGNMKLFSSGSKVMFSQDSKFYYMKMK